MRLRELQRDMQRHLLGEASGIVDAIVDAPPLTAAERLAIYRNAYQVRLIDALHETYPVLHALLGDSAWVELGRAFVAAQPSVHRSIRWYGGELEGFLAGRPPYVAQPILAEIARLEWTLAEVFDAKDAEPLARASLASIHPAAWGVLRIKFHPSLRRLTFAWNTVPVWKAMNGEETPPLPALSEAPVPWLLWRKDLQNYFRSMAPYESAALDAALRGLNFSELCEALAEWLPEDEVPQVAATLLSNWADSGLIVAFGEPTGADARVL